MKRKSVYNFVLVVLFAIPIHLMAQVNSKDTNNASHIERNTNENSVKTGQRIGTVFRNNISAHLGAFDPWLGLYYEKLVSPYWGFDIAAGLIGGSVGTKVYFLKLSEGKFSMYTGISEGVLLLIGAKHYIPLGFTYIGKSSFRISLDIGPQTYHNNKEELQFGFTLKIGKSF